MTPEAIARKLFSIRRFRRRGYAKDLANELGCSPSAVYNWRASMRVPPDRVDQIYWLIAKETEWEAYEWKRMKRRL